MMDYIAKATEHVSSLVDILLPGVTLDISEKIAGIDSVFLLLEISALLTRSS